jgi:hypothetical protein
MAPLAISLSTGDVILIVVLAAIPVALLSFVLGAGDALRQIGRGQFAVQFDSDLPRGISDDAVSASPEAREAELRQLLAAKAYRQRARGEDPLDVDAELARLLAQPAAVRHGTDPQLVEEVRQLVIARNARRLRRSQEPLDVELEVERQLRELDDLGQ